MEDEGHFRHGETVPDTHAGAGAKGKVIFHLFTLARVWKHKPLRIKPGFLLPEVFISVEAIKKGNNNRSPGVTDGAKMIILQGNPFRHPCSRV